MASARPLLLSLSGLLIVAWCPRNVVAGPPGNAGIASVSHEMASFVEQLSDVKCTEKVTQTKFSKDGHTEYAEQSTFDYLVLLQASDDELLLNESRLPVKRAENRNKKNVPLLITNGFSNLMLIFHPYYRNSFEFQILGQDLAGNVALVRVHFAHIPGMRTPLGLSVRGREFPLSLQGTAWIDPQSGMVTRIEASLERDMSDVGLKSLTATVNYEPVQLPGWSQAYRFPQTATIDVETLRQRWRNVHHFTNYQRFMVNTESTVASQENQ
jgi:hypothetical protein